MLKLCNLGSGGGIICLKISPRQSNVQADLETMRLNHLFPADAEKCKALRVPGSVSISGLSHTDTLSEQVARNQQDPKMLSPFPDSEEVYEGDHVRVDRVQTWRLPGGGDR